MSSEADLTDEFRLNDRFYPLNYASWKINKHFNLGYGVIIKNENVN